MIEDTETILRMEALRVASLTTYQNEPTVELLDRAAEILAFLSGEKPTADD